MAHDPAFLYDFRMRLLADPRYGAKGHLSRHGAKVFSQFDEDGIIAEIFRRIGATSKTFVEFGVEGGTQCNSLWLLMQGWKGLWLECENAHCQSIRTHHRTYLESGQLDLQEVMVTRDNIDGLIATYLQANPSQELDLLSIDIDGNDYWVWQAVEKASPRVVVIEYNATWLPPADMTVPYDPDFRWNGTSYFGASLAALARLAQSKGYALVCCNISGVNAFFVRRDLLGKKFHKPGDVDFHYEPARYFLAEVPAGHAAGFGPVTRFES